MKRMGLKLLCWVAAGLALAGCSTPHVVVDAVKTYPPRQADSVRVFAVGEPVPNSAESLGRVVAVDGGLSSDNEALLWLARQETADRGGNGLMLTVNRGPDLWGNKAAEVSGQMLYLRDMVVDTTAYNPVMEAERQNRLLREQTRRSIAVPRHTVYVRGGFGWVGGDVYAAGRKLDAWGGGDWMVEYRYSGGKGWGVSLLYAGLFRDDLRNGLHLETHAVTPALAYTLRRNRFLVRLSAGFGPGWVDDGRRTDCRFTAFSGVRAEYMLSPHWGVNFGVSSFTYCGSGAFADKLQTMGLDGGVQLYF